MFIYSDWKKTNKKSSPVPVDSAVNSTSPSVTSTSTSTAPAVPVAHSLLNSNARAALSLEDPRPVLVTSLQPYHHGTIQSQTAIASSTVRSSLNKKRKFGKTSSSASSTSYLTSLNPNAIPKDDSTSLLILSSSSSSSTTNANDNNARPPDNPIDIQSQTAVASSTVRSSYYSKRKFGKPSSSASSASYLTSLNPNDNYTIPVDDSTSLLNLSSSSSSSTTNANDNNARPPDNPIDRNSDPYFYRNLLSFENRQNTSRCKLTFVDSHQQQGINQARHLYKLPKLPVESIDFHGPSFTEMGKKIEKVYDITMTIGDLPFRMKPDAIEKRAVEKQENIKWKAADKAFAIQSEEKYFSAASMGVDVGHNEFLSGSRMNNFNYVDPVSGNPIPMEKARITSKHMKEKMKTIVNTKKQQKLYSKTSPEFQEWHQNMPTHNGNSYLQTMFLIRHLFIGMVKIRELDANAMDEDQEIDIIKDCDKVGESHLPELMAFNRKNQILNMKRESKIAKQRFRAKSLNRFIYKLITRPDPTFGNRWNRTKVCDIKNVQVYFGDGRNNNGSSFPYVDSYEQDFKQRRLNPYDSVFAGLPTVYKTNEYNTSSVCPICVTRDKGDLPCNESWKYLKLQNGGSTGEIKTVANAKIALEYHFGTPYDTVRQLELNLPEENAGKGVRGILRCQSCLAIFNRDTGVGARNIIISGK